jgi:hypothetical protein
MISVILNRQWWTADCEASLTPSLRSLPGLHKLSIS